MFEILYQCDLDVISTVPSMNVLWHIETLADFCRRQLNSSSSSCKGFVLCAQICRVEILSDLSLNQSLKSHLAVLMARRWTPLLASGN